ncbi:SpoIIE family protein phosphatase [Streptomyces erythrochromogenes]|uniref:SpoIIE family protein phosphatase n=1 Tax=Streptomyces erythrochromogenes TaxID=285574 RepID=UPI0038211DAC
MRRALARTTSDTREFLGRANDLLIAMGCGRFATCCFLRVDPVSRDLTVSRAGHVPRVWATAGGHGRRPSRRGARPRRAAARCGVGRAVSGDPPASDRRWQSWLRPTEEARSPVTTSSRTWSRCRPSTARLRCCAPPRGRHHRTRHDARGDQTGLRTARGDGVPHGAGTRVVRVPARERSTAMTPPWGISPRR